MGSTVHLGETARHSVNSPSRVDPGEDRAIPAFSRKQLTLPENWDTPWRENHGDGTLFPTLEDLLRQCARNSRVRYSEIQHRSLNVDVRTLSFLCSFVMGMEDIPVISGFATGSYNAVLLATFRNMSEILVRIPYVDCRSPRVIASSVATMAYAKFCLDIPCPNVIAWQDGDESPIGAPFVILEKVQGRSLHDIWPLLSLEKQFRLLCKIAELYSKLTRVSPFGSYGCLYFSQDNEHATTLNDPSAFEIGSLTGFKDPKFGDYQSSWPTGIPTDIPTLWKQRCLKQMEVFEANSAIEKSSASAEGKARIDCSIQSQKVALEGLIELVETRELTDGAEPCLVHPDLVFHNIVVDDTNSRHVITAILDWDGAAFLPRYLFPLIPRDLCEQYHSPQQALSAGMTWPFLFPFLPSDMFGPANVIDYGHFVPSGPLEEDDRVIALFNLMMAAKDSNQAILRASFMTIRRISEAYLSAKLLRDSADAQAIHLLVANFCDVLEVDAYREWLIARGWRRGLLMTLLRRLRVYEALRFIHTSLRYLLSCTLRRIGKNN